VTINNKCISTGDFIAISGHDILAVAKTAEDALIEMIKGTPDLDELEILTVFVGKNIDEQTRAEITERLEEEFEDLEVTVYEGGQDVYDYLIALE
jgi:dihydroxyacetone kinase-like predicted kinase